MDTIYTSGRIYPNSALLPGEAFAGGIVVSAIDGKVTRVLRSRTAVDRYLQDSAGDVEHVDFGDLLLMPGLIDTHVHINEPGRTEWEGFHTATKAAAAGGFTTVCDMPLNSIPPTTSVRHLRTKVGAARGKIFVDVAFWGGLVPDNEAELRPLIDAGVIGFKCFLCPSGVDEFPHVTERQVLQAARLLEGTGAVLAFHAELAQCHSGQTGANDPRTYRAFLETRPPAMERRAVELVANVAQQYDVRAHVVHLSTAQALPTIRKARARGARLTVETCHHYLSLAAEDVPDARTEYKCCPPIRDRTNREQLWRALQTGDIDLVVSDHSPSPPQLKLLTDGKRRGNFLEAWGGISSLQLGLPLFWTGGQRYGMSVRETLRLLCTEPARLAGLQHRKGRLDVGYDGDMCVWDPEGTFTVTADMLEFQHKATPYLNRTLQGVVHATVLRGTIVYRRAGAVRFGPPMGSVLLDGNPTGRGTDLQVSERSKKSADIMSGEDFEDDVDL